MASPFCIVHGEFKIYAQTSGDAADVIQDLKSRSATAKCPLGFIDTAEKKIKTIATKCTGVHCDSLRDVAYHARRLRINIGDKDRKTLVALGTTHTFLKHKSAVKVDGALERIMAGFTAVDIESSETESVTLTSKKDDLADKKTAGEESAVMKNAGDETADKKTAGVETTDKKTSGEGTADKKTAEEETVNKKTAGENKDRPATAQDLKLILAECNEDIIRNLRPLSKG